MLRGNRSIDEVFDGAPDVDAEKTGTLDLGHVSWLQLNYELLVGDACRTDFFPPGLHPTEPVVVNLQVWDVDDSPAGPFQLAQVRLTCRAGVRIRALQTNSVIDGSDGARRMLSSGWAYRPVAGAIDFKRFNNRWSAEVAVDGRQVLKGHMNLPQPLNAADLQHIANMNPGMIDGEPLLLQVEPTVTTLGVLRGAPVLENFDSEFWNLGDAKPGFPVIGAGADVTMALPPIRFMQDPVKSAIHGTRRVA